MNGELTKPLLWWIDIETSSGQKVGSGPLLSGLRWLQTRRLDRAGEFVLTLPAGDARQAEILHKRVLRCWAMAGEVALEIGAGIVDYAQHTVDPAGVIVLEVKGDDLLRELTYRSVGFLQLAEEVEQNPANALHHIPTSGTNTVLTNALDGNPATGVVMTLLNGEYLYFRHSIPFRYVDFDLSTFNSNSATMTVQYFNGGAWVAVSGLTDGTAVGGKTLAQDGRISWTAPTNEQMVNHTNEVGYWIRMTPSNNLSSVEIREVTVKGLGPQTGDVADIMAFAPAGWSLDTVNFYDSTAEGSYQQFAGESVLAGLVATAKKPGEHFRLGSGRVVQWLQNEQESSGLRAVQNLSFDPELENNPDICLIVSLKKERDTFGLVTRIYPYGSGNGQARVSLAEATESVPAGYTLDTANNYIKHDLAETTYGRIEIHLSFKDIVALENDPKSRESAANQLLRATVSYLEQHKEPAEFYRLSVTKVDQVIYPGQTIHVSYFEAIDGYTVLDIEQELVVLETAIALDVRGVAVTDLLVATVPRFPAGDMELLAEQIEAVSQYEAHQQPVDPTIVLPPPTNPADGGWVTANGSGSKSIDEATALDTNTASVLISLINSLIRRGFLAD